MRRNIAITILIAFLISVLNITPVVADDLRLVLHRDGVGRLNLGPGTATNQDIIKADRTPDLSQVYSVAFLNQSTIAEKQPSGKYYRTVGYDMRLTDKSKNPLTDYIRFDYKPYRDEYVRYMRDLIRNTPGLEFNKPYVSQEILYREYFLKHFPAEKLDKAKYLEIKGIVEIYEVNRNGSERILYTITKDNWKSPYPYGFEKLRSDIETRFVYADLNPPSSDFYPLPEGATEYRNEFRTLAKTYKGKAGEEVEVKFTVNNSGEEGTTDVGVTWFGSGWSSPLMHEKGITLKKGESRDFSLKVAVPKPGEENRLVVRVNVDGKTPADETNQDNNIMIIKVMPEGVDVACMKFPQLTYKIKPGEVLNLHIPIAVTLKEPQDKNLRVPVNIKATQGFSYNKNAEITIFEGYFYDIPIKISKPGVYTYRYEAFPIGMDDINPNNNIGEYSVKVELWNIPKKEKNESGTRVNLID